MSKIDFKIERVKEILDILATHEQVIFRGGTALSLAYDEIKRSSEDIDFSILKGENNLNDLINMIMKDISELEWVEKIEIGNFGDGEAIIVEFENKGVNKAFDIGFTVEKILLELPKSLRKEGEIPFVVIPPYLGSDNEMKVMSIEAILKDKGMAITERFLSSGGLEWAVGGRAHARHIYDFFVLYDKYIRAVDNELLKREVLASIVKKDNMGYRKKYTSLSNPLDIVALWETFKTSYNALSDDINKKINSIVYPNAKAYNKNKFLKQYKIFFYRVLEIINTNH